METSLCNKDRGLHYRLMDKLSRTERLHERSAARKNKGKRST